MRKIFAIVLVALLLGVGVVALIETDPGYVLISYGNYTLETSLWVGSLLLVLFVLLFYAALRLIYRLIGGQHSLVSWLGARKSRHASRLTNRGLISFTEGNWSKARRQLVGGAKNNEAPLINYLMAARSSYHLQEPDKISEYLGAATDVDSGAAVAVALTRAEMDLQNGRYAQAVPALEEARRNSGRHPRVMSLLQEAYYGLKDWDKLAELLPELKKHKIFTADELQQQEREVHGRLLRESVTQPEGLALDNLRNRWQKMPAELKRDPQMLQGYVHMLIEQGAHADAEKVILRALKQQWNSNLVRQYGYVQGENIPRQLAQAESWLAAHTDDAQLLLCLGRLSSRDKLWGKARDYFESSYRLERSAETCAELGRLLTALGEPKVAAAYFREGLMMQESSLPQLPMPEKVVPHDQRLASS